MNLKKSYIDFAIHDTHNCISVVDASYYNPELPVSNPVLEVVGPNVNSYLNTAYTPNTVFNVNTVNLFNTFHPECLADGIYTIRMSVDPNNFLFKSKTHLRVHNLKAEIYRQAQIELERCNEEAAHKILLQLLDVDIAVNYVACNNQEKGIALYNAIHKMVFEIQQREKYNLEDNILNSLDMNYNPNCNCFSEGTLLPTGPIGPIGPEGPQGPQGLTGNPLVWLNNLPKYKSNQEAVTAGLSIGDYYMADAGHTEVFPGIPVKILFAV
jgi:hypothetical protein